MLPKGMEVLIGFTPDDLQSLVDFASYSRFMIRMMLVFGVAFEIPLFVVMLNLAGVVSGRTLGRYRPWIVVGTFVFAAVATPSTDPFSMVMLAIPMTLLFLVSEVIARLVDRRRAGHVTRRHRRRRALAEIDATSSRRSAAPTSRGRRLSGACTAGWRRSTPSTCPTGSARARSPGPPRQRPRGHRVPGG